MCFLLAPYTSEPEHLLYLILLILYRLDVPIRFADLYALPLRVVSFRGNPLDFCRKTVFVADHTASRRIAADSEKIRLFVDSHALDLCPSMLLWTFLLL